MSLWSGVENGARTSVPSSAFQTRTLPADTTNRRRAASDASSRNTRPSSISTLRPAANASTVADQEEGWPNMVLGAAGSGGVGHAAVSAIA
jgi:hypothetical protein